MRDKISIFCLAIIFIISGCFRKTLLNTGGTLSQDYYKKIPIKVIHHKILLPVEIKGESYNFILDTGAPTIVSYEVQKALGLPIIDSIPIRDINKKTKTLEVGKIDSLIMGGIVFQDIPAIVMNLNADNSLFRCFNADGMIGSNLLRNSIIQLDVRNKQLIITDKASLLHLSSNQGSKITLGDNQSSPFIYAQLNGTDERMTTKALIDLGASEIFTISSEQYEVIKSNGTDIFYELASSKGATNIGVFGLADTSTHFKLLLPGMEINGFEFRKLVTTTSNDNTSKIGSKVLKYGVMTLDYKNKRFYFQSYGDKDAVNVAEPDYGFALSSINNQLIVGHVWRETLKKKISYGDSILTINDRVVKSMDMCDLFLNLSQISEASGSTLNIKIKTQQGQVKTLNIEKRVPF